MKKWLYLIPPLAGVGIFVIVYMTDIKKMDERKAHHKVEVERQKAEEAKKKADAEQNSQNALADKSRKKKEEDAKKAKDREEAELAKKREIKADTDDALVMVGARNRQIMALEREITDLKAKRAQANNEFLATVKTVEALKEDRRKAEFEYEKATAKVQDALANNPVLSYPVGWSPGNIPITADQAAKEVLSGKRKTTNVEGLPTGKTK